MHLNVKVLRVFVGLVLMMLGLTVEAAEVHQQAILNIEKGNYKVAGISLQAEVKVSPRDHQAWFLLGVLHAKQQYFHQAIEAFRRVIELKPTLAEPHNNLAVIYNELDDVQAAVKELEQSLKKRPDYAIAEENIADLYVKLALKYYKRSLEKGVNPELEQRYSRLLQVRDPRVKPAKVMIAQTSVKKAKPEIAKKSKPITVTKKTIKPHDVRQDVLAAIEFWRAAWSGQRVDDYFAAYGKDFKVKKSYASLQQWQKVARRVISQKTYLDVQLNDISVVMAEDGMSAKVEFTQYFKSNNFNATGAKFLRMQYDGQAWKIVREGSVAPGMKPGKDSDLPGETPAVKPINQKSATKVEALRDLAPDKDMRAIKPSIVAKPEEESKTAILAAVEAWRTAWSAQNVDDYFSAYGKEFKVKKKFGSLMKWKEVMRRVISNKAFIDVQLDDLLVKMGKDGETAQVRFLQYFRSDTYQDDGLKMLKMKRFGENWKIVSEESIS